MQLNTNKNTEYNFKNIEFEILDGKLNFTEYVNSFLKKIKIRKGYISVIVNIKQINGQYFSVGGRFPLQLKDSHSISTYIEFLYSKHSLLEDRYRAIQPISIIFNYTSVSEATYNYSHTLLYGKNKALEQLNTLEFRNEIPANLPLNTNYATWGAVERLASNVLRITNTSSDTALPNLDKIIQVQSLSKFNKVIEIYSSSNILLSTVTDTLTNPYGNEFTRQVGDKTYYIKNNKVFFIFENIYLNYKNITKARLAKKFSMNILTLDVETFKNEDQTMSIYCISLYDGKTSFSYYLSDFHSINELMQALLIKLFSREYAQKTIYIHNSSNFDLIFLLKYIVNKKEVLLEPMIKDGNFINLKVKYGPNLNYYINIKDSYLILPHSLDSLAKDFKVETLKGFFPHEFVKKTNLNYIGEFPAFSYFNGTNLTYEDYLSYSQNFKSNWDLKKSAIQYCEKDCVALYQTLMNFSNLIFKEFSVNVSSVSTLPSLAFKIFRANYLSKNIKLPVIEGNLYSNISKAYYGGHCDVYLPTNPKGSLVYEYDCNSMFPFVMQAFKYPGKILGYFRGNISTMNEYSKLYSSNLSFLKVEVTAPKNLTHPILPYRAENVSIYGVGKWTGWYYSEEIKNAESYGYQFRILEGYIFQPTTVFVDYVKKIFQIKATAESNTPMYTISKLLLNTLYGRFGLSPVQLTHEVVTNKNMDLKIKELGLDNIDNIISFGDASIVSFYKPFSKTPLINVGIAAAITANARIYMSQFKNNPNFNILYTDTDSYFTLNPLPDHLIDEKKLGLFKLVHVFKEFVALSPKVYGGIDIQGNEIIKTKGLKPKITFSQLKSLLDIKALSDNDLSLIKQTKWFNSLEAGTITEKDVTYSLKPTDNKRNLIYSKGLFVKTTNKEFKDK